jgi:arylsulfatase
LVTSLRVATDVGVDTRTPVDDRDYHVPFRFTGELNNLTIKLGPVLLPPEAGKKVAETHHNLESLQ